MLERRASFLFDSCRVFSCIFRSVISRRITTTPAAAPLSFPTAAPARLTGSGRPSLRCRVVSQSGTDRVVRIAVRISVASARSEKSASAGVPIKPARSHPSVVVSAAFVSTMRFSSSSSSSPSFVVAMIVSAVVCGVTTKSPYFQIAYPMKSENQSAVTGGRSKIMNHGTVSDTR